MRYIILLLPTLITSTPSISADRLSNEIFKQVIRRATELGTLTKKRPVIHSVNRAELQAYCAQQKSCQFPKHSHPIHFPPENRGGQCLCDRRTEFDTKDTVHILRLIEHK